MALIWMDGFDHYGGSAARLLDGVYSQTLGVTLTNVGARTGSYCAKINTSSPHAGMRRVLPVARTTVGCGFAFNIDNLPIYAGDLCLLAVLGGDIRGLATLSITPTGAVQLRRGSYDGPVVAQSAAEVVMPDSFQHFECEFSGENCEVRINGVTVLNTTSSGVTQPIEQLYVGGAWGLYRTGAAFVTMLLDDLFARDGEGPDNNSWIGDKKVYTRFPATDGPDQDWTISVGDQSWAMLDNVPPLDNSEYLTADVAGKKVSVGIAPFPSDIVSIAGVYVATRLWKNDAGNAKVQVQVESGAASTANPTHPISTAPVWYGDVAATNPETGAPWLISEISNLRLAITRDE